jgi:uncharacterized phosphosugar-binding protein
MNAIDAYYTAIGSLLAEAVERERDRMEAAAGLVADCVQRGGLVYVTGTGHAHMLAEEPFYRAGGLAAIHPILVPSLMLHEGAVRSTQLERSPDLARDAMGGLDFGAEDVLIVASHSGRNAFPVEAAMIARERDTPVIAVTSVAHGSRTSSRHSSGERLMDVADIVLDTGVPYGDATVPLGEGRPAVAPASTVVGVFLMNAVMARATQLLFERGADPDVFVSANRAEGEPMAADRLDYWRERIRLL